MFAIHFAANSTKNTLFLEFLESSKYFGYDNGEATNLLAIAQSLSVGPIILGTMFVGPLYDFAGRRITLSITLLIYGLSNIGAPWTAPSQW